MLNTIIFSAKTIFNLHKLNYQFLKNELLKSRASFFVETGPELLFIDWHNVTIGLFKSHRQVKSCYLPE